MGVTKKFRKNRIDKRIPYSGPILTLTKAGMAKPKEIIERAKKATRWDRRESTIFFPESHFKGV